MPSFFIEVECSDMAAQRINVAHPDLTSAKLYALGMVDMLMRGRETEPWRVTIENGDDGAVTVMTTGDNVPGTVAD